MPRRTAGRRVAWARPLLLLALLGVLTLGTDPPWAWLWLAVPLAVAVPLLVAWRFGAAGAGAVVLGAAAFGVLTLRQPMWAWWIPAAALTGAWMGTREEGPGPAPGQRAWMLAPLLVLAAALPWLAHYRDMVAGVGRAMDGWDAQSIDLLRQMRTSPERLAAMQKMVTDNAALRRTALPHVLPTVLFLWVGLLVTAGRGLAGRTAGALRWPRLSRGRLIDWRLPDVVLWVLIAGLALLLSPWRTWAPTGWTLLLAAALGFCVQGVAVVESLFLARGIPPAVVVVTLLFIFFFAMPAFVLSTLVVGLSDAWLDFRRLEPDPSGDRNLGDR